MKEGAPCFLCSSSPFEGYCRLQTQFADPLYLARASWSAMPFACSCHQPTSGCRRPSSATDISDKEVDVKSSSLPARALHWPAQQALSPPFPRDFFFSRPYSPSLHRPSCLPTILSSHPLVSASFGSCPVRRSGPR